MIPLDAMVGMVGVGEEPSGVRLKVVAEPSGPDLMLEGYLGKKLADPPKRKRSYNSIGDAAWAKCVSEATRCCMEEDWSAATPRHLVAFYALCHKSAYGVMPVFGSSERVHAAGAAKRMLEKHFGGRFDGVVDFMRWVWVKERDDERWRKSVGKVSDWRVSWKYQFSESLLCKWMVFRKRSPGVLSALPQV